SPHLSFFFLYTSVDHRPLHSFPTRRSSDLSRMTERSRVFLRNGDATLSYVSRVRAMWSSISCSRGLTRAVTGRGERMRASGPGPDRKSTRLNSSHVSISYAVFCLKKKNN